MKVKNHEHFDLSLYFVATNQIRDKTAKKKQKNKELRFDLFDLQFKNHRYSVVFTLKNLGASLQPQTFQIASLKFAY